MFVFQGLFSLNERVLYAFHLIRPLAHAVAALLAPLRACSAAAVAAAAATSPSAVIATAPAIAAAHVDLGCFSDAIAPTQRGLPYAQRIAADTTPARCEDFCAARGFAFSGTELRACFFRVG